jgi:CubicO group peptidase (beta-lactamase class C family)
MVLNGGELDGTRLLGPKTIELMTIDHLPEGVSLPETFGQSYRLEGYGFGLGVRVRTDVGASQLPGSLGEYGWGGAYETYVLIDPAEDLVALYMLQLRPSSFYPLRRQFTTAVYQALVR